MRIPGVTKVHYLPASALPERLELLHDIATDMLAGVNASLLPLQIVGEATFDIEESYPSNSLQEKVTLTFSTPHRVSIPHSSCLVVDFADGSSRLIGSRENQPTIVGTDATAGPEAANRCSWQVELTAKKASIDISTTTISGDEGDVTVIGELLEVTEPEIDNMINNLE